MDEISEVVEMVTNPEPSSNLLFIIVLCLVAIVFVLENIKKFKEILGIKDRWDLHEENQGKQILELKKDVEDMKAQIDELKSYSEEVKDKRIKFEEFTTSTLNDIRDDMIEEKIERIRSSIIEFASCLKLRDYNQESYTHIFDLYSKYAKIIEDNHLKNGYIEVSIEYIKKRYAEQLAKGFKDE